MLLPDHTDCGPHQQYCGACGRIDFQYYICWYKRSEKQMLRQTCFTWAYRTNIHFKVHKSTATRVSMLKTFMEEKMNKVWNCIIPYHDLIPYCHQHHLLKERSVTVQCVPVGSCSAQCCGSERSLLCPRWCRTVHRVCSRSRSLAQWTPLL